MRRALPVAGRLLLAVASGIAAASVIGEWLIIPIALVGHLFGFSGDAPDWANDYIFVPMVLAISVVGGCATWWVSEPKPRSRSRLISLIVRGMIAMACAYAVDRVFHYKVLHPDRDAASEPLPTVMWLVAIVSAFSVAFWLTGRVRRPG